MYIHDQKANVSQKVGKSSKKRRMDCTRLTNLFSHIFYCFLGLTSKRYQFSEPYLFLKSRKKGNSTPTTFCTQKISFLPYIPLSSRQNPPSSDTTQLNFVVGGHYSTLFCNPAPIWHLLKINLWLRLQCGHI